MKLGSRSVLFETSQQNSAVSPASCLSSKVVLWSPKGSNYCVYALPPPPPPLFPSENLGPSLSIFSRGTCCKVGDPPPPRGEISAYTVLLDSYKQVARLPSFILLHPAKYSVMNACMVGLVFSYSTRHGKVSVPFYCRTVPFIHPMRF